MSKRDVRIHYSQAFFTSVKEYLISFQNEGFSLFFFLLSPFLRLFLFFLNKKKFNVRMKKLERRKNECNKTFRSVEMEMVNESLTIVDRYTLVLDVSDDY